MRQGGCGDHIDGDVYIFQSTISMCSNNNTSVSFAQNANQISSVTQCLTLTHFQEYLKNENKRIFVIFYANDKCLLTTFLSQTVENQQIEK